MEPWNPLGNRKAVEIGRYRHFLDGFPINSKESLCVKFCSKIANVSQSIPNVLFLSHGKIYEY